MYRFQIIIFLLLNWLDVVFTAFVILHGGREVMPITGFAIANFGLNGLIIFKILVCMGTILFLQTFDMLRLFKYINILMTIICFIGILSILTIMCT